MVSESVYGCLRSLLLSEGTYWCLRVHSGVWGYLLVSEGGYILVPNGVWECLWVSQVPNGVCGCLMVSHGVLGWLLLSVWAYWCLRVPMGVCTISEPQWPSAMPNMLVLHPISCLPVTRPVVDLLQEAHSDNTRHPQTPWDTSRHLQTSIRTVRRHQ